MKRDPGARWPRTVLAQALLLGPAASQCAPASPPVGAPGEEARLSAMERQQQAMLALTRMIHGEQCKTRSHCS